MRDIIIKFFLVIICVVQLFYLFEFRSNFQYEIIKNPFAQSAGKKFAVSAEIIESNIFLEKYNVYNFYISEGFKNDTYLKQRVTEFNYPIKINKSSKNLLYLKEENIPSICSLLETGDYVKLIKC
tara:strand:- start:703 stop:1077 length:375 start_codon:yes stop_codon:yes gene_type:complete